MTVSCKDRLSDRILNYKLLLYNGLNTDLRSLGSRISKKKPVEMTGFEGIEAVTWQDLWGFSCRAQKVPSG